jgi:glycosyltransferase involved in cell wall biosynthesis
MVVHAYYPLAESRVQRQAEALVDAGFHVDVICLRLVEEQAYESVNGVNVYRLPVRRHSSRNVIEQFLEYMAFFWLATWRLTVLHLRLRYKVVQVHNLPDFLVFTALIPRIMGAKIILDLHDLTPEFYASRFKTHMKSWPVKLIRWQERISCGFADYVITVTETWRKTLLGRGLSPDKCGVIMNLADYRIFQRDLLGRHWRRPNGVHILYHGTLTHRYGIDLGLQALSLVLRDLNNVFMTIHGRGEFLDDLKRSARTLAIGEHVYFSTEFVPIEDLPELIATADLGIVPYRKDIFTDGILPTKLMEYAAMGIPVLAARTSAISEYFDETMVEFFTPGNVEELACAIKKLIQDSSRLEELRLNIQKFNHSYRWDKHREDYVRLVVMLSEL